jgi:PLD-like domain
MKSTSRHTADRGVAIRIYLDGAQFAEREPAKVFRDLAETSGVEIRIKHENSDPVHFKCYQIDGRWLRTGAANFSASGLKRQDNDLIVIESAGNRGLPAAKLRRPGQGDLMTATLQPFAVFALLACSPAFAQTICHDPPAGMFCPGDRLVRVNTLSCVYHFQGERYFGCTKTGKFLCQHHADREADRPTRNGQ